jgi:transcriptional regulator with XRE-family HTH domain
MEVHFFYESEDRGMDAKKTGELIAMIRQEKNLSRAELSSRIKISEKVVARWEDGKGLPDPSVWKELTGELGIGANELLLGEKSGAPMEADQVSVMVIDAILRERRNNRKRRRKYMLAALIVGFLLGILLHRYAVALLPSSNPATAILRYSTLHGLSYTEGQVKVTEGIYDPVWGQQYFVEGLTSEKTDPPFFFYLEKGAFGYTIKSAGTGP